MDLATLEAAMARLAAWAEALDVVPADYSVTTAACLSLGFVVLFGNVLTGTFLSRLGTNGGGGYGTRALGWDNLRGEFGWLATVCIVAPWLALVPGLPTPGQSALAVLTLIVGAWWNLGQQTCHPGGPRAHRILRAAQFPDKTWYVDAGWECAIADESHERTHAELRNGQVLTGEPAGRQTWHRSGGKGKKEKVGFNPSRNPNVEDGLWRAQRIAAWKAKGGKVPDASWRVSDALDAARKAMAWYQVLQADDGHWAGDYGGPLFLLPGLVVVWYVTGQLETLLGADRRAAIAHYLRVHQQTDGGWGMHIESPSTMFGATLCYVALRLLGEPADSAAMVRGRAFLHANGGCVYTGSWAKLYLCLLGAMEWEGHQVIPPEAWLLPQWVPFHPARLWCHCRMVYLPMSFLYGEKFVYARAETDPLVLALREELYVDDYSSIDWPRTRDYIADIDNYSPVHPLMIFAQKALVVWEDWGGAAKRALRKRGMAFALEYMHAEDAQTNYVDIGPVNKVLNMLSCFIEGGARCVPFERHLLRVADYLWVSEDGMKMQGYNGSQGWDTSFAMQAIAEAGLIDEFPEMSRKAFDYMEATQILCTPASRASDALNYEGVAARQKFFRHVSEGGWPFSSAAHGWPISDCTAEGLKSVLAMRDHPAIAGHTKPISDERLFKAANVLLTLQNKDGGWATYENNRGYGWFEWLNPSEVFGDIMIDYSYVECSMASLSALYALHKSHPTHRAAEVQAAIRRGRAFIRSIQRADGSWYGSWGCCFTYGTWFGVEGLVLSGEPPESDHLRRACAFLLAHQNPNGGWGEDFTSCYDKAYAQNGMETYGNGGSGVVNTAWALLALLAAGCADHEAVARGARYLMEEQLPNGDWKQEGIAGVFNRACGISYTQYRNIFPMWALARYARRYPDGAAATSAAASRPKGSPKRAARSPKRAK